MQLRKEKNKTKIKKLIQQLTSLAKQGIARALYLLDQEKKDISNLISKNSLFDKNFLLYCNQKGYLDRLGFVEEKTYATFLSRASSPGQGELLIARLKERKGDPSVFWLSKAAILGNEDATKEILNKYWNFCTKSDPLNGLDELLNSDILCLVFKAGHELRDQGKFTNLIGDFFSTLSRENFLTVDMLKKNNKDAIYWYKKAKKLGNMFSEINLISIDFYSFQSCKIKDKNFLDLAKKTTKKIIKFFDKIRNTELESEIPYLMDMLAHLVGHENQIDPEDPVLYLRVLDALIQFGQPDQIDYASFLKANRLCLNYENDPVDYKEIKALLEASSRSSHLALVNLGNCYAGPQAGFPKDVNLGFEYIQKAYQSANENDPKDFMVFHNLGNHYSKGDGCQENIDEGIRLLQIAIRLNPDYVESRLALGFAYEKQKKFLEAKEAYKIGHKLNGFFADFNMAICDLRLQNLEEAKIVFEAYKDQYLGLSSYFLGIIELFEQTDPTFEKAKLYFENAFFMFKEKLGYYTKDMCLEHLVFIDSRKKIGYLPPDGNVSTSGSEDECDASSSADDDTSCEADAALTPELTTPREENQTKEEEFDYEQFIDRERELTKLKLESKAKAPFLKEESLNKKKFKLSRSKQKILEKLFNPQASNQVKWAQIQKLLCDVMEPGDYFKSGSGSRVSIKIGEVQTSMHKPHNDSDTLCPGRREEAKKLLKHVALNVLGSVE